MNVPPPTPQLLIAEPAYPRLKECLIAWTGLAYYADKDRELATRIAQRLERVGLSDCGSYLALLQNGQPGQTELDVLIADLTIGETFFFRHREMFEAIRTTVIPDLIVRNRHTRTLRIWSAGCSIGAEPYSVAILLKREFAEQLAGWDVTIVGTDVNREFLTRAREGSFDEWAFRGLSDQIKQECFTPSGKSMLVKPQYREGVSFQYHNLVTHPFPSLLNNLFAFDVILCRNVTIYFSTEIVRQLTEHFYQSLVEGGWMLVGHAEPNVEFFRSFRAVNAPGAVLYQKSADRATKTETIAYPLPAYSRPVPGPVPTWVPPRLDEIVVPASTLPRESSCSKPTLEFSVSQPEHSKLDAIRELADRGEWVQAAALSEELIQQDRLNHVGHFYRALVLEQMGQHAEAEQTLRRVIYLDRSFVQGHYYLGLLLQKNGKSLEAIRAFQNVLKLLARIDEEQFFADGDGIRAGELRKLTEMHLSLLKAT